MPLIYQLLKYFILLCISSLNTVLIKTLSHMPMCYIRETHLFPQCMSSTALSALVELPLKGLATPPITFKQPPNVLSGFGFIKRHITKWQAEWEQPTAEQWKWCWGCSSSLPYFQIALATELSASFARMRTTFCTSFPISPFTEQLLQSSIVESPKESDSSVWYHLNLNQHNTVAITPVTS